MGEKGFIVHDQKVKEFLDWQGLNYEFYWHNETPFNEPDTLLNENFHKDIILLMDSHCYLLVDFKDPTLQMLDPLDDLLKKSGINEVLSEMNKNDGGFGLISKI